MYGFTNGIDLVASPCKGMDVAAGFKGMPD
jgi:hypothetical protein